MNNKVFFGILLILFKLNPIFSQDLGQSGIIIKTGFKKNVLRLLGEIETASNLIINYSPGHINLKNEIIFGKNENTIHDVLNQIAEQENLRLVINDRNVYLVRNFSLPEKKSSLISVSGYLKDFDTGEPLIDASVRTKNSKFGQYSDNKGYFNLKIPEETDMIIISYIGYAPVFLSKDNLKDGLLGDISLKKTLVLKEIIIKDSIQDQQPEIRDFERQKSSIDVFGNIVRFGTGDVFNDLILKPGIHKINDFQGGLSVNGQSPGDNIYFLDGIRVFEPNHIFGLFSSFGSKPVSKVSFFSNNIPTSYAGAFSSVIDFHTREGNSRKPEYEALLSNSVVNLFVTAPIRQNTTSFFVDYRHSLLGMYLPKIIKKYKDIDFNKLFFNDLNFKITHRVNQFNRMNAFYYQGQDQINLSGNTADVLNSENNFSWRNQTTGFLWTYIHKDDLKSDLSISLSKYNNDSQSEFDLGLFEGKQQFLNIFSSTLIRETSLKNDLIYYRGKSRIKFGYNISRVNHSPQLGGIITAKGGGNIIVEHQKDSILDNFMSYISADLFQSEFLNLKAGLQAGILFNDQFNNKYLNPQFTASVKISGNNYIDFAFSKGIKFIHSLGSYAVGIPSMIWVTSGTDIPVSGIHTFSINYIFRHRKNSFRSELYYKSIKNDIIYKSVIDSYNPVASKKAVIPLFNDSGRVSENISIGEAQAFGINLQAEFIISDIKTSYSLSVNKFNTFHRELNDGKWFPGKFNMNYAAAATLAYNFKNINIFADWKFHAGQVFSLPVARIINGSGQEILDFSKMNNAHLSDYHSLDIGMNSILKLKSSSCKLSAGFTNILNNFNPVYAYIYENLNVYKASEVGGIPLNPYISLDFRF